MASKIRELIRDLERAGFVFKSCKGSHRKYYHPGSNVTAIISGNLGDDADKYQEKHVVKKIRESQQ